MRLDTPLEPGDKYVVQISDEILPEPHTTDSTLFSTVTAPELVETKLVKDKLVFTFDRPVEKITDETLVKVDGLALDDSDATLAQHGVNVAGNYAYEVNLVGHVKAKAQSKGKHEVVLFEIAETSTNLPAVAEVLNGSYTVTEAVEVAPIVEKVVALNSNKFFIQTDQEIDAVKDSFEIKKGTHKFTVKADEGIDSNKTSELQYAKGTLNNEHGYYVVITDKVAGDLNPLYRDGEKEVTLSVGFKNYKHPTSELLGKPYSGKVTLSQDLNNPAVLKTELDDNKINVTFKNAIESAVAAIQVPADVVIKDKDGIVIPSTAYTLEYTDEVAVVEFNETDVAKVAAKAPYTVEFKAGKVRYKENTDSVAAYQLTGQKNKKIVVTARDTEGSKFKYAAFSDLATVAYTDNVITMTFNEKMDASAINKSNYKLDGASLSAETEIDFVGDTKTIQITFPKGTFTESTKYKLTVSTNVKTESGKIVVKDLQSKKSHVETISAVDNVKPELTEGTYLVPDSDVKTTNKIKVTFDETVEVLDDSGNVVIDFDTATVKEALKNLKIVVNENPIEASAIEQVVAKDADKMDLIITLKENVNVNQAATVTIVEHPDAAEFGKIYITDEKENEAVAGTTVTTKGKKVDATIFTDQVAVDEVDTLITSLPTANTVALTDKTAIETARAAYEALTPAQQALVADVEALETAEAELAVLEAVVAELSTAKLKIEALTNAEVLTATTDDQASAKTKVENTVNDLAEVTGKGFTVTVNQTDFTADTPGTTDGEYKFTVTLEKAGQTVTTAEVTITIPNA